jgi:hypothetical protein
MARSIESLNRLWDLEDSFTRFPGRRPGGNGATGIGKVSSIGHAPSGGLLPKQQAVGYDRMVRDQMEYEQLLNPNEAMKVRHNLAPQSLAIDALLGGEPYTGPVNPAWTDGAGMEAALRNRTGTGRNYQSHEQFKKRYGR